MTTKAEELANELRSLDSESAVAVGKLRERFSAGVLTLSFYIIGSEEDDFMLPATKRRQEMRPSGELYFIYVPSHIYNALFTEVLASSRSIAKGKRATLNKSRSDLITVNIYN